MSFKTIAFVTAAVLPAAAYAGEKPLYQPAPAWVVAAPPIDPAKLDASAPVVLVLDNQQRLEGGKVWTYVDTATRVATPELLNQMGTVAIPWMPDKGDLIVHSAEIIRGGERIDLLAGSGEKFTVLRREQQLERRTLDGQLTATMSAAGLRLGDVLRVRVSITAADAALKGELQAFAPVLPEPFRAGFARIRLSWPIRAPLAWRSYAEGLTVTPVDAGGYRTIEIAMPIAKQPDLPGDTPARFQRPPIVEATSFADWRTVSRTMAPLFATDGLIAAGSPLAGEVAKIAASNADPVRRMAAALQLVQDQIGYLALGMNGGNYVPQAPAATWQMRYGDCKAKTLLLLAMLHGMGIAAEPVLVSATTGDLVAARLPMPAAFDHVIVRADAGGRTYWLDGTATGTRVEDLADTPPFRQVLPLRAQGAELTALPTQANARPDVIVTIRYDQSAGIDLPALFTTEVRVRGSTAAILNAAAAQAGAKQKRQLIEMGVRQYVGEAQLSAADMTYDRTSGISTLTASGVLTTGWAQENRRMRLGLDRVVSGIAFDPDRSRPAWRTIPVATGNPETIEYRTTFALPDGGRGFALEGDAALAATLAGVAVSRQAALDGGTLTVTQRAASSGAEIAPTAIAEERARLALAKTRELRISAPADLTPRWQRIASGSGATVAALEASFAKAIAQGIADDPTETTGYESRLSFRRGIYDYRGAIEDATKLLAIGETRERLLDRSALYARIGDTKHALADAEAAVALDPGNSAAVLWLARQEAGTGRSKAALDRVGARVDAGGKERFDAIATRADLLADTGDTAGALAALDGAITEKPGDPFLLNNRCWVKGTRKAALDTALKDCTKAIELDGSPAAALDSRAMVYFQLGRMDDALADLDAALDLAPNLASSLYLRGVIRKRTGKAAEGERDLKGARLIEPVIDKQYALYGITA